MSGVQARFLAGTFVLIFAGVAVNAMLLQEPDLSWSADRMSAPATDAAVNAGRPASRRVLPRWNAQVTASIGEEETAETVEDAIPALDELNTASPRTLSSVSVAAPAGRSGAMLSSPSTSVISVTAATSAGKNTVRAIQRELTARGYQPGPVDGIAGVMTRAAVMAFEADERMRLTADPSEALLERIILGGVGPSPAGPGASVGPQAQELTRSVQAALVRLGYAPGAIDGIARGQTAAAIRKFEADHSMVATGRISGRLVAEIARVGGARFSIAAGW
ncbi:MAG: peptidoglycan-binding domain-containing protein [Pseudomonadota bacterium]